MLRRCPVPSGKWIDAKQFTSTVDLIDTCPDAIIAVGANIGDRVKAIRRALKELPQQGIRVLRYSRLYESAAAYVTDQPNFVNAAVAVKTDLSPHELLRCLKVKEAAAGRSFGGQRYGPRPLDLDIIAHGPGLLQKVHDEMLELPHPRWRERDFVKAPLTDLYSKKEIQALGLDCAGSILMEAHRLWDLSGGSSQLLSPALRHVIPCKDQLLPLQQRTLVMGILNATPDSFSDGNKGTSSTANALHMVKQMVEDGADFIDIGGQSTRPGADYLEAATELDRVMPIISSVARQAVLEGADIVNDVSGGRIDTEMLATVAELEVPYIMMHSRGRPKDMQSKENTWYSEGAVAATVANELSGQIKKAVAAGIEPWRIIPDPGIGFAKSGSGNIELLRDLKAFSGSLPGCLRRQPVLIGPSRKGFLGNITGIKDPKQRDMASAVTAALATVQGASILRMHNVKAGVQAAKIADSVLYGLI